MIGIPALVGDGKLFAQLAIIAATISYAFAGVYGRRFKALAINPVVTAAGQVTASTMVLLPIAFTMDGPINLSETSANTWRAITGLAVVSTAIAYVLYSRYLSGREQPTYY